MSHEPSQKNVFLSPRPAVAKQVLQDFYALTWFDQSNANQVAVCTLHFLVQYLSGFLLPVWLNFSTQKISAELPMEKNLQTRAAVEISLQFFHVLLTNLRAAYEMMESEWIWVICVNIHAHSTRDKMRSYSYCFGRCYNQKLTTQRKYGKQKMTKWPDVSK